MDNLENFDPNQIKQLIGLLQSMLPEPKKTSKKKPADTKTKNKTVTRSKRVTDNDRENKFLSMPEMNMHKSDTLIDKQLNKFPPTPRSRDVSLVKVICRVCGKKDEVSPKLIPESVDRYKCNNCSSTQG